MGVEQAKRFVDSFGSRQFIIHLTDSTLKRELDSLTDAIKNLANKFDRKSQVWFVLHDQRGLKHLNLCIISEWLSADKYVSTYNPQTKRVVKPFTRPKRFTWDWYVEELQGLVGGCVRRIVPGKADYHDEPLGWLRYVLRLMPGDSFHDRNERGKGIDRRAFVFRTPWKT